MKTFVLVGASAWLVAIGAAGSGTASARPRPALVLTVPTPIRAFAGDGAEMAWLRNTRPGCAVFFRRVAGGTTTKTPVNGSCPFDGTERWLALGGKRAVWATATSGNNTVTFVETAARGQRRSTRLRRLDVDVGVHGDYVHGAAGDGATLVYSVDSYACTNNPNGSTTCSPSEDASSGVWRIAGSKEARLQTVPARAIAAAGRRIGVLPSSAEGQPRAVELRSATTGALMRRVEVGTPIRALALSSKVLVVAATPGLELFDPRTGASRGSVRLPQVSSLSASGDAIVVTTRKVIRLIDASTKHVSVLASRRLVPVGLSIEGHRVLWAENPGGHGRIYSLSLNR